jgi:Phosphotransferase enzyme family
MARELFETLDEMLAPETLSRLTGRTLRTVRREPFHSVDALSGGKMWRVFGDEEGEPYILKRISYADDWIMRVTEDHKCRAVVSWQSGLLDRLPADIAHETLACARDEDGWAILLRDVGPALVPPGDDLVSVADNQRFMDAMAALNAEFWDEPGAADPALGFATLSQRYRAFSDEKIRPETRGQDMIPPIVVAGWDLLPELVEHDVADLLLGLRSDPEPLVAALGRYPQTVIHGDWKMGNLGIHREAERRVVLLDWAAVGSAPPAVELAWYLSVNCARLPVSKEATIDYYRRSLAQRLGSRFDADWWRPQLELGLLGGFLQLCWPKAYNAVHAEDSAQRERERGELAWWSDCAREGAKWL